MPAKRQTANPVPGAAAPRKAVPKQIAVPSGARLIFESDDAAILIYIGAKDISEKCGKEAGEVIYQTFHDGRRLVSMPNSYQVKETPFEKDHFFLVILAGETRTRPEFNPMKDFIIFDLGEENETVDCDFKVSADGKMTLAELIKQPTLELTLPAIADLNYSKLNYPLRRENTKK